MEDMSETARCDAETTTDVNETESVSSNSPRKMKEPLGARFVLG